MPLPHSHPQSPSFLGHVVRYELSRLAPGTRMASSLGISFILSTSRRKVTLDFERDPESQALMASLQIFKVLK